MNERLCTREGYMGEGYIHKSRMKNVQEESCCVENKGTLSKKPQDVVLNCVVKD
jgi:hypothetical protein